MAQIGYEGSPLQEALKGKLPPAKDIAYQESQLKKDVDTKNNEDKQNKQSTVIIRTGRGNANIQPSSSSPTGYADILGQPVSVSPEAAKSIPVNIPKANTITSQLNKGTISDTSMMNQDIKIKPPGTIYQYQIGEETYQGRTIPFYDTYTIGEDYTSRKSTKQEREMLQEFIGAEEFKETALSKPRSKLSREFGELKGQIQILSSEELYNPKDIESSFSKYGTPGKIAGGFLSGLVPSTKGELIETGAITLVSAGAGFLVKGATSGAVALSSKFFGPSIGAITGTGLKLGTIGAGVYFTGGYVSSKANEFSMQESTFGKSEVIGSGTRELGAGIIGFGLGSKGYDITEGLIRTRGRTFIDVKQGVYPEADISNQLNLFKKNVYPEFGNEPGAFHTTSNTFWKGGKITPEVGTSELPGLYASTQISTPFSRITGSGSKTKLIPNMQDIFSPPNKPGVAFLKPEGFREVTGIKTKPYKIGEQEFNYKFTLPPKKGFADIPKIKTEIETIFRPEAGSYGLESKGYYTKIHNVRVPIDVFKYSSEINIKTDVPTFKASSYSSYKPSAIFEPSASVSSIYSPKYSAASFKSSSYKLPTTSFTSSISITGKYKSPVMKFDLPRYDPIKPISKSKGSSQNGGSSYSISNIYDTSSSISKGYTSQSAFSSSISTTRKSKEPIIKLDLPGFNFKQSNRKIKRTKIINSLAPSFTSQSFDIRGSMPKLGKLGITPMQLRKVPI
jgi:hypothetical protein